MSHVRNGLVLALVLAAAAAAFSVGGAQGRAGSSCHVVGALQDARCTPGRALGGVTAKQVCKAGYASHVRNVPDSVKRQVYLQYGILGAHGNYEVDHLVSLELGGSNDIRNLWPEAAGPTPGFHEKDRLENRLHALVCAGTISLRTAQHLIRTDWLAAYSRYVPQ